MDIRGIAPSIFLINPKFPHNVGTVKRVASCYGIKQVWYTGNRVNVNLSKNTRLPREMRMRKYKDVKIINYDYPLKRFSKVVPVAIELLSGSQCLYDFIHPDNAVYIFGPEDGSVPSVWRQHCHHFVFIPTKHCLNLAAAVNTVIYDRFNKEYRSKANFPIKLQDLISEEGKWIEPDILLFDEG